MEKRDRGPVAEVVCDHVTDRVVCRECTHGVPHKYNGTCGEPVCWARGIRVRCL